MYGARISKNLRKRYAKEKLFKAYGITAIVLTVSFLVILFSAVIYRGAPAFINHKAALEVDLTNVDPNNINYLEVLKKSSVLQTAEQSKTRQEVSIYKIFSKSARSDLKRMVKANKNLVGTKFMTWFYVSSNTDMFLKGKIDENTDLIDHDQIVLIKDMQKRGLIKTEFNFNFFKYADSSEPDTAGMAASIVGSFLTIIIFLLVSFPIGVMAAFYLEEFAPKNTLTDIVEVSINNLAAIPSIIFGLLGFVVYLNFMHLPRSSTIVGGLTLAMLVLPVIIIGTRNAIRTIPSSIKDAASAMGATKVQVMFHHTFPLALPGIMTGTILAVSRALGETAPLLMIGMVAFIADVPQSFSDPATVMPVQIYLWSDSPELGFAEKSAAAIMVLLAFLVVLNSIAVFIRNKFEKKW